MKSLTFDRLVKHLNIYGPEYVMEAAQHLPEDEQRRLEALVAAKKKEGKNGRSKG